MLFRERPRENPGASPGGTGDGGDSLDQARERVDQVFNNAFSAIERAMEGDSENFIRSCRQQGGQ